MKRLNQLDIKNKKYIIFDMDGTLIDSIGVWNYTDQRLILKYADKYVDEITIQSLRNSFLNNNTNGDTYVEYCKFLTKFFDLNCDYVELNHERALTATKILASQLIYKDGAVELLYKLKELGFTLILATMTTKKQIDTYSYENPLMAKLINLYDVFDYITTIDDVKEKKPNPEIYLNILKHYNADKIECLIFEDSYTGVLAARKADIDVINVYDKYSDLERESIDLITDYKIDNFEEFLEYIIKKYTKTKTKRKRRI